MATFISCIKLVNMYHSELEEVFISETHQYLQKNKDFASSGSLTLFNLLCVIRDIYNPISQHHRSLIHGLFSSMEVTVEADSHPIDTQIAILITASTIKTKNIDVKH